MWGGQGIGKERSRSIGDVKAHVGCSYPPHNLVLVHTTKARRLHAGKARSWPSPQPAPPAPRPSAWTAATAPTRSASSARQPAATRRPSARRSSGAAPLTPAASTSARPPQTSTRTYVLDLRAGRRKGSHARRIPYLTAHRGQHIMVPALTANLVQKLKLAALETLGTSEFFSVTESDIVLSAQRNVRGVTADDGMRFLTRQLPGHTTALTRRPTPSTHLFVHRPDSHLHD